MENIMIIDEPTNFSEIQNKVTWHSDYIKGVVDLQNKRLSLGGSLHADGEQLLISQKPTESQYLWGFNLYPNQDIAYESLINIKPKAGNKSIVIADQKVKDQVKKTVFDLIKF